MTPSALSIITTTFEEGAERNKALGIWGALGGIGATTAWLIGGPIVDGLGWEWIFFINIPVGLGALALAPVLLRESTAPSARRSYDPAGALTITAALALLVYAVVEAPDTGWTDPQTITLLAACAVLIAAFTLIESRHPAPLVPLRIFRSRTILGANAVMLVFGMLPYGLGFILTLYAQQVLGYSAVRFGLTSLVFPVTAALGSVLGQAIVLRAGFRPVAATGMALMGAGAIFFGLLVVGPGVGLAFVTASIAALAGVPERDSGIASGLSNTNFQIGAALGVANVTTVAISRTEDYTATHTGRQPAPRPHRRLPIRLPRRRHPRRHRPRLRPPPPRQATAQHPAASPTRTIRNTRNSRMRRPDQPADEPSDQRPAALAHRKATRAPQ
jgi:hypothetical protein